MFTILFLDFGLTLQQFALLNVAWAAAIVLLEVPSGALADVMGRRNLLIAASILMVIEIALLCFVPMGYPSLLFAVFLMNRVLSGTAEAAASGADEALAYDSLKREGNIDDWVDVLDRQIRVQSLAFIVAMSLGAAVYDPDLMQHIVTWTKLNVPLTQKITLRFPLYLTFGMAVLSLVTTLRMQEIENTEEGECFGLEKCGRTIGDAFKVTFQAGGWILKTPFALIIILSGLLFDNVIRMIMTLNSQYLRLIDLPEASFGLIGSGLAMLGLFVPRIGLVLVKKHSALFNLNVTAALTLSGLAGMTFFLPIAGLAPLLLIYSGMILVGFFLSHYLNRITSSRQRATVLSFKGMSFNLAYGLIGLLYSLLLAVLRSKVVAHQPNIGKEVIENLVFVESIAWFPWYFLVTLIALVLFARWQLKNSDEHTRVE